MLFSKPHFRRASVAFDELQNRVRRGGGQPHAHDKEEVTAAEVVPMGLSDRQHRLKLGADAGLFPHLPGRRIWDVLPQVCQPGRQLPEVLQCIQE